MTAQNCGGIHPIGGYEQTCTHLKHDQVNSAFSMWMGTHFKYAVLVRTNCVSRTSAYLDL